jgi:bifunctional non-homologous end joining protein LigD
MSPGRRASPAASGALADYQRKRDFDRTPEPAGSAGAPQPDQGTARFVVQRHRARRLHYDFRLEIGGVLVSWAVPKGPTLDPTARHMAVHVEDHPIEYADFEGVIPAGQYGGGDVIVWDRGTWSPHDTDDPAAAVAAGELHLDMYGERLRGRFVLVRRGGRGAKAGGSKAGGREDWLILHKRDEHAVEGWDPEEHPTSVLSGRTNDEVKADPDRLWRSDLPADRASVELRPSPPTALQIAELQGLGKQGTWEVFGRALKLTNLDKVLFPARGDEPPVTKRELVAYAAQVAPTVLPYVRGRALNMHRYPDGAGTKGFWHKQLPSHAPTWLASWDNPEADPGETTTYLVPDEPAALVWAANFGALEWHPWTSCTTAPHRPTYVLLDIDPGPATPWEDVLVLARLHRTALEHLKVTARPKVTGRRGIQIWVPVAPTMTFDETRAWAEGLSKAIGAVVPELVSWKWGVAERGGLARLDYTQNAINKTLVAPYSPRAAPGAPVSVPLEWDELDDDDLRPDRWTIRTVGERLQGRGDPFAALLTTRQALPNLA